MVCFVLQPDDKYSCYEILYNTKRDRNHRENRSRSNNQEEQLWCCWVAEGMMVFIVPRRYSLSRVHYITRRRRRPCKTIEKGAGESWRRPYGWKGDAASSMVVYLSSPFSHPFINNQRDRVVWQQRERIKFKELLLCLFGFCFSLPLLSFFSLLHVYLGWS